MTGDTTASGGSAPDPETDRAGDAARLGYRSVTEELTTTLSVDGDLPAWLEGTFVRNGPGRFEVGDRSVEHWFDGLAMLRRFRFDDGAVEYANRFLRTEAFESAKDGSFGASGFAETPDRGPLERVLSTFRLDPTDNANADVARVGDRYVALTESPRAVEFDPTSLATRGEVAWNDDLPVGHTTPHLVSDPAGAGTLGYLTSFLPRSAYHLFRIPPDEPSRERIARIPVENPAYMHSLAATPDYLVLTEMPFVLPPRRLLSLRDEPLIRRYEWRPQQLTRFLVVDRADGSVAAEHRVPPFVVFHHVNAFRDGGRLVVDLVAFDSPSVFNGMRLDRLRSDSGDGQGGELRRYRLPLEGGSPSEETVATDLALPRIREDRTGRPYRFAFAQDTRGAGLSDAVAKVDLETGRRETWNGGEGYPGEPVFVPAPDGDDEDDGVLLVETLVPGRGRSELVVLDAREMTERARAAVPHAIPFGFHGQYFPEVR